MLRRKRHSSGFEVEANLSFGDYADDTTIYARDNNIEGIIETLESDALNIAEWFPNNCMKLNEDKCHLMIFGDKSNDIL